MPLSLAEVSQLGSTINTLLKDTDLKYGSTLTEAISADITSALHQLEHFAIHNSRAKSLLTEQRLKLAQEQLTVMRKEQEDFCGRLDNDLNHAIAQWKGEVLMLRATVQDLEERKANLGAELNEVMQRLHLLDDRRVQDEVAEDQLKFEKEVSETVSKLERFVDDKKGDLMEAHHELDQGLTDLEKITRHLKKLHKENEVLVRENADLVEEMSDISAKQLSFQLRLNRILSRAETENSSYLSKEYFCVGDN